MRAYRREGVESAAELAQKSGMPLARCEKLWPILAHVDTSLDQTFDDARGPVVERLEGELPSPEEVAMIRRADEAAKLAVRSALKRLDRRERRIVHARMLSDEPCTLEELGKELGVSKERVRQLEVRVRDKLRDSLSDFAPAA